MSEITPLDLARKVVAAWEALPGGRNYSPSVVEVWLRKDMAAMVNDMRQYIASEEAADADAWEIRYRTGFEDGEKHAAEALADAQSQAHTYKRILDDLAEKQITGAMVDVVKERRRQVEAEGWTPEHDDAHQDRELPRAAACYAIGNIAYWPWSLEWWKPSYGRRDLVKAASLLIAEIERIDRVDARNTKGISE